MIADWSGCGDFMRILHSYECLAPFPASLLASRPRLAARVRTFILARFSAFKDWQMSALTLNKTRHARDLFRVVLSKHGVCSKLRRLPLVRLLPGHCLASGLLDVARHRNSLAMAVKVERGLASQFGICV